MQSFAAKNAKKFLAHRLNCFEIVNKDETSLPQQLFCF